MIIFKRVAQIAVFSLGAVLGAEEPDAGPYFFMSDDFGGPRQFPWGRTTTYGGVTVVENFNLLAHVLGDEPEAPKGQKLVDKESFSFGKGGLMLQPFATTSKEAAGKRGMDIASAAPKLKAFLEDPLGGGAKFDLSLPFRDARVALSDSSALLRKAADDGCWHTAIDFDVSGSSTSAFDVIAPADGVVEGNADSTTLAIRHAGSNGKGFLCLFSHLIPESKAHLKAGVRVKRGEVIGRCDEAGAYTHLHFAVAVKGPARRVKGASVPELWYVIDPLGVYDYRRAKDSATDYNYLPNNTLEKEVRGIIGAYVFRTNPPTGSLISE